MTNLQILQHALGLDKYGRGMSSGSDRNRYVCGPGSDLEVCKALVEEGLMEDCTHQVHPDLIGGKDHKLFMVTRAGRRHIIGFSPSPPKRTRSQLRYDRWLHSGMGDIMGFGEWIKAGCP